MLDKIRQNAQSWVVKALFGVIIIVFIFFFGTGGFNDKADPIMAYVDERPISAQEFSRSFNEFRDNLRRQNPNISTEELQDPRLRNIFLNDMITSRLLEDKARALGVAFSGPEMIAAIAANPAFQNQDRAFDPEAYSQALARIGLTASQFEQDFRTDKTIRKLEAFATLPAQATPFAARQVFSWVKEKVDLEYAALSADEFMAAAKVEEAEVKDFYENNKERFKRPAMIRVRYLAFTPRDLAPLQEVSGDEARAYYQANSGSFVRPEQVRARHILIKAGKDATSAEIKRAGEDVRGLRQAILSGRDFAETAKARSQDPSAKTGGDLGWFGRGVMVPEFEEAAFGLKKGELSEPVRTPFGWHLILVEDRRDQAQLDFEQVKDDILKAIAEEKASDKISELLDQAMDRLASGMTLAKIADDLGLVSKQSGLLTLQEARQQFGLTEDAAAALFSLPPGESAKTPLAIDGGLLLAEKVEDSPETILPLDEVKQSIAAFLKRQEAMKLAKDKAQALLKELSDPASAKAAAAGLAKLIRASGPLGRRDPLPGLGLNPQLLADAFSARTGDWLPQAYAFPDKVIIARLSKRLPALDQDWEKEKDLWLKAATAQNRQELFMAFATELRDRAKIELLRPDLLN
ncbi:MAG: SurA N-terminal domain-containing protein [Desulfovibrionaceae bacterium]|nr:SurA N-terminal domain-containing protein [Desulfovibrionaceae bacterium]